MTVAIFDTVDQRIAKDAEGCQHVYSTQEQAEAVAKVLNDKETKWAEPRYQVKPI